jgi:hypothetical protein
MFSVIDEGEGSMRGKIRQFASAASIAALALVVSLVSASVAGPNVTRLVVVEHATTDTVIDLTVDHGRRSVLRRRARRLGDHRQNRRPTGGLAAA